MIVWWSLPAVMTAVFLLYMLIIRPGRQYAQDYGDMIWWLMAISGSAVCALTFAVSFLIARLAS